jgi:hypothetical protein
MYNGHDRDNLRSTFVWYPGFEGKGAPKWIPHPDTPGRDYEWSFGGSHPGGWQVVFCDSSVRFLGFDIDPTLHQNLGNRKDGNVIDQSQL